MAPLTDAVRARFGDELGAQLGHGGEATVYELGADRVLRLYHEKREDLGPLAMFYEELSTEEAEFAIPRMLEHGEIDGLTYTIDARIPGRSVMDALAELAGDARAQLLDAYFDAAAAVGAMSCTRPYYGEITRPDAVRCDTWPAFLLRRMDLQLAKSLPDLTGDISDIDRVLTAAKRRVAALPPTPERRLVHGDYFPGNVMCDDDGSITGVIDFGPLTAIGDAMMDLCGAVIFVEAVWWMKHRPEDSAHLRERLVARYGNGAVATMDAYRAFYAVRFSDTKSDDARLYEWCLRSLQTVAD